MDFKKLSFSGSKICSITSLKIKILYLLDNLFFISSEVISPIINCKMTINNFIKLIEFCGLEICFDERYIIRPSHEIRYGLKIIKANWMRIPILEEIMVSGCTYILKLKN